jgi:hypothetical protein
MATFNTAEYTKQADGLLSNRVAGQIASGDIRIAEAVYTTAGTEAASDLVNVITLPIGAVVLPENCRYAYEASGGTGTAISTLGDAGDDDRYSATSVTITSAGTTAVTAVTDRVLTRYAVTASTNTVIAKLGLSSGSVTAGKKIKFVIAYRLP